MAPSTPASPAEKATMSTRPKPIRPSEMVASITTSADGHGRSPPDTPSAKRLRQPERVRREVRVAVVMAGIPVVVVMVARVIAERDREARAHERGADADHEERLAEARDLHPARLLLVRAVVAQDAHPLAARAGVHADHR